VVCLTRTSSYHSKRRSWLVPLLPTESTLELLQQFYVQVESVARDHKVFPGDQSTFSLKCFHCGKKVTPMETLGKLLFMTPMAICHHLKICSSISPGDESQLFLKKMPVLFTSIKNHSASKCSFDNAIYKTAGDKADELFTQRTVVPIMV
jgi:hypothetical protein